MIQYKTSKRPYIGGLYIGAVDETDESILCFLCHTRNGYRRLPLRSASRPASTTRRLRPATFQYRLRPPLRPLPHDATSVT